MRWMCLDPGEKRTGVALSSPEETFAIPLTVLEHSPAGPSMTDIDVLREEHSVEAILIGIPVSMDDTLSAQSRSAIEFARSVADHLGVPLVVPHGLDAVQGLACQVGARSIEAAGGTPVMVWDERLSTWSARHAQPDMARRRGREQRPKRLDAHAAAVILQSYLDTAANARRGTTRDAGTLGSDL